MNKIKKIFVAFALLIFPLVPIRSIVYVSIPDTIINRARNDTIPIYGSLNLTKANKIQLVFQFNAYLLDIKGVLGGETSIIEENSPSFEVRLNNLYNAELVITSFKIKVQSNLFFKLIVEGLAHKDSVDSLKLISLSVSDTLHKFEVSGGKLTIRGPTVIPIQKSYISNGIPLPADKIVNFNFGIEKASFLSFEVFNENGEFIFSSQSNPDKFLAKNRSEILPLNQKFEAGDYSLELYLPIEIATGLYFLRLKAYSIGTFNSKFLVVK
ncbi:MAG: hypothetical protein N2517_03615 [Ignavibacteria bacterium]|nr:hypothetical protein [Ignavibacteria bacterium]